MRNNVEENIENTEDIKTLLSITKIEGQYYVYHKKDLEKNELREHEKAYVAIKYRRTYSKSSKGLKIEKGMKIKLGRITFVVKDFSTSNTNERDEEKRLIDIL